MKRILKLLIGIALTPIILLFMLQLTIFAILVYGFTYVFEYENGKNEMTYFYKDVFNTILEFYKDCFRG